MSIPPSACNSSKKQCYSENAFLFFNNEEENTVTISDSVLVCWREAYRLHEEIDRAYDRLGRILRERPADDEALSRAQAQADALGKRYERLCERDLQNRGRIHRRRAREA
jgi:hypothetical protein